MVELEAAAAANGSVHPVATTSSTVIENHNNDANNPEPCANPCIQDSQFPPPPGDSNPGPTQQFSPPQGDSNSVLPQQFTPPPGDSNSEPPAPQLQHCGGHEAQSGTATPQEQQSGSVTTQQQHQHQHQQTGRVALQQQQQHQQTGTTTTTVTSHPQQKQKRKRRRRDASSTEAAAAAAVPASDGNTKSSIRAALRQAARSGSATYDESLIDEILQKQLGDNGSARGKKKKMFDMAKEVDTEAMIAFSVGFPADSLTEEEIEAGVVSSLGGIEQANYIIVRNHILARWRENVSVWLQRDHAMESIRSQHKGLVNSAYNFLLQHGYINFGVAPAIKGGASDGATPSEGSAAANVVVIGAGLAGLAATRHLLAFGFKVVVVEGRRRPGGRVFTRKMQGHGHMAAADLGGSVITGIHGNPFGVLARQLGVPLHKVRDKCPLYQPDGQPVDPYLDAKVEESFNRLLDKACQLRQAMDEVTVDISLGTALETFRRVYGVANEAEERRLLDWHLANLEYANAGLLSNLSLAFWDQDDPYEMGGDHCFLPGGNGRIIQALAEGLPIFYDKTVQTIRYGTDGVQVLAGGQVFQGDMVLCTVPLGVLKAGKIKFLPELPQRKVEAIKRLGFGLLNKVAMLFPTVFWGAEIDTFGHLCDITSRRGEFFLFYSYASVSGGPLLVALVAGEAAINFESTPPTDAVEKILKILRGIYGPRGVQVPDPIQTVCTRWGSDPFCLGSYSHVAVGSSGDDYDVLAESVGDGRVFFAGEATNRRYPATMHGAFLSGLREAANISKVASSRTIPHKVDKGLTKDNGDSYRDLLDDLFREPDLAFGGFSILFDPQARDLNSMSLLRVVVGGNRKKTGKDDMQSGQEQQSKPMAGQQVQIPSKQPPQLYLYSVVSRQQALEVGHVSGGDEDRLRYLCEKLGVRLVGRRGMLGGVGEALVSSLKFVRSSQNSVLTATPGPFIFGNKGTQV